MTSRRLVIFARAPEPGRSKTRLIPRLGPDGAARLHAAFLSDIGLLTRGVADERVLAAAGALDHPALARLAAREGMPLVAQAEGDLGARMAHAIATGLAHAARVCIIGSDSPTLVSDMIDRAFALLDGADVVFGPADDGGYWLVGARRPCEPIFSTVEWGTPSVLARSLALAAEAHLSVALADRHWDVDEPADLERLRAALAADRALAPSTRATLDHLC